MSLSFDTLHSLPRESAGATTAERQYHQQQQQQRWQPNEEVSSLFASTQDCSGGSTLPGEQLQAEGTPSSHGKPDVMGAVRRLEEEMRRRQGKGSPPPQLVQQAQQQPVEQQQPEQQAQQVQVQQQLAQQSLAPQLQAVGTPAASDTGSPR